MTAKSTKGVKICLVKGGATPTLALDDTTATAISNANPAVVTVTASTGVAVDDVVTVAGTGTPLDGGTYIVSAVTATEITLLGADLSAEAAAITPPAGTVINVYGAGQLECPCFSAWTFNPETPNTISVATFCDPSASIPSAVVGAGTVDIAGFIDITDTAYSELLAAVADGNERIFRILLPNNGAIVAKGVLSTLNWDIPLDGAQAYSGTIALSSRPVHLF